MRPSDEGHSMSRSRLHKLCCSMLEQIPKVCCITMTGTDGGVPIRQKAATEWGLAGSHTNSERPDHMYVSFSVRPAAMRLRITVYNLTATMLHVSQPCCLDCLPCKWADHASQDHKTAGRCTTFSA